MQIKSKIILVTVAGSGIGRELVISLLEKRAKVAATDIREESLQELVKLVGAKNER